MAAALATLIYGAVQVGLVAFSRAAVTAAANAGAQAASTGDGTDQAGQAAALQALSSLGALGASPNAVVTDGSGSVTVETSVQVVSIVPFLSGVTVRSSFTMAREPAAP